MSLSRHLFWLAAAAAIAGCTDKPETAVVQPAAPVATMQATKPGDKYLLRATDIIRVEMYQEQDFRPEVSVSQEGDVVLPLIGKTHIAGKTLNDAQQLITERYREYFKEPNVTLLLVKYAERKVYIDGMVGRPGPVIFPPEERMTIGRAIASASGILPRGERSDVKLKRIIDGKETTITIDMDAVSAGKAADIELLENDYIYVRDSRI